MLFGTYLVHISYNKDVKEAKKSRASEKKRRLTDNILSTDILAHLVFVGPNLRTLTVEPPFFLLLGLDYGSLDLALSIKVLELAL